MVDLTILVIYTILEGVIAQFEAGIEPNKENPSVTEGVSSHLNVPNSDFTKDVFPL